MSWLSRLFKNSKRAVNDVAEVVESGNSILEKANFDLQSALTIVEDQLINLRKSSDSAVLEAQEQVKRLEKRIDIAIAPDFVEIKSKEFEQLIKGTTAKKTGERTSPKKSAPIVIHYYNNGLIVAMSVRWPQKKFTYRASYTWE